MLSKVTVGLPKNQPPRVGTPQSPPPDSEPAFGNEQTPEAKSLEIDLTALPGASPWLLSRNAAGRVAHYHVELRKQG